jgi:hypothetical protein
MFILDFRPIQPLIHLDRLDAAQGEKITESLAGQRDLLSLLVRASTIADPRERLSDVDILARKCRLLASTIYSSHHADIYFIEIPTFFLAGHETTSSLMAWILFELGAPENAALQVALRAECRSLTLPTSATDSTPLETPELAALDKLPLLDAIVRETLRLHSPISSSLRSAVADDVIPLSKPYVDRAGVLRDSINVSKGDGVYVPISIINRSVELWGSDAGQWKPERWMDGGKGVPTAVKAVPGVWGNVMTFLGGAHACIGYRFTLYEYVSVIDSIFVCIQDFIADFGCPLALPQNEDYGACAGERAFVRAGASEDGFLCAWRGYCPADTHCREREGWTVAIASAEDGTG